MKLVLQLSCLESMERGTIMTKKVVWSVYINESITHDWKRKKDALDDVRICLLEGSEVTLTRVERIRDGYDYTDVDIQFLREAVHTILEKHYNTPIQPLPQAVWDDVIRALSVE